MVPSAAPISATGPNVIVPSAATQYNRAQYGTQYNGAQYGTQPNQSTSHPIKPINSTHHITPGEDFIFNH